MRSVGGTRFGFDLDYDEKDSSYSRIKSLVTEEFKQYFRPEFLNRLDDMIVFGRLTKLEVKEIADIMLKEVFERLKGKEIQLQVTDRFRDRVVDVDSDSNVTVLNASGGAPPELLSEPIVVRLWTTMAGGWQRLQARWW
ncbi:putative Clp ATPase, P-loop containing nucleoside triphosphate hydrolase [Helianthus annuus]|uniref:Clp ATPase, P-loop containing nucleoside triphosphate hydrolase n=1 Tax=Helianthus annuus TaxID=4232 RepID=A0A251RVJ5_HELAN|nr:putative Clp ATPase, P-loop containing nucleoside triphosphate hydrolase [Helianthus annuus]